MTEKTTAEKLREPFPPEIVGKLPRVTCRECSQNRGSCAKHKKAKCQECGAWVSPAHIHLDYVGHAAVTDRLLKVDDGWNWEPMALDEHGAPLVQVRGNTCRMWIKLTIDGVTRLGVGTCGSNKDEAEKELIGDAIRNAAMRFGVALDLWSKGALNDDQAEEEKAEAVLTDKELEDIEASIHFAESMDDLRKVAKEIKGHNLAADDSKRLLAAWQLRREDVTKEEAA